MDILHGPRRPVEDDIRPARSENVRRLRNELQVGLLHHGLLLDSQVIAELADKLDRHGVVVGVSRT